MKNSTLIILGFLFFACSSKKTIVTQTENGATFKVCDVEVAEKILPETTAKKAINFLAVQQNQALFESAEKPPKIDLLCSSKEEGMLVQTGANPFASAVYFAYAQHRPLVISPDMIWLLITQGFARHVKENAEDLREIFVDHEGQINLDVKRASYQPKSKIYWEGIFPDFSKAIAANTKEEVWGFVAPKFSTTTMVEKAAFEITLMDAMSPYFQYSVSIICGIPEITLEGKSEDWDLIEKKIEQLNNYGMNWWTDDLKKIIREFKLASRGTVNQDFWESIFLEKTYQVGCGSEARITGWMLQLFPYIKKDKDKEGNVTYQKNPILEGTQGKFIDENVLMVSNIQLTDLPLGLSKAKVLLNDNGAMTTLNFNAGFVGITQDEKTKALRPDIQWYVTDLNLPPTADELEKYKKSFE